MNELWTLEYRSRERSNGKWSDWKSMDNADRLFINAFSSYPEKEVVSHSKYERRAVKFTRAATPETK